MRELYSHRKETIERIFGTAKENHGFRYTQMIGKARMEMKVGLTFAYMNLKKLARMLERTGKLTNDNPTNSTRNSYKWLKIYDFLKKTQGKMALGFAS